MAGISGVDTGSEARSAHPHPRLALSTGQSPFLGLSRRRGCAAKYLRRDERRSHGQRHISRQRRRHDDGQEGRSYVGDDNGDETGLREEAGNEAVDDVEMVPEPNTPIKARYKTVFSLVASLVDHMSSPPPLPPFVAVVKRKADSENWVLLNTSIRVHRPGTTCASAFLSNLSLEFRSADLILFPTALSCRFPALKSALAPQETGSVGSHRGPQTQTGGGLGRRIDGSVKSPIVVTRRDQTLSLSISSTRSVPKRATKRKRLNKQDGDASDFEDEAGEGAPEPSLGGRRGPAGGAKKKS
ncbi:hypothetical protein DFH09DRAFT_1077663 [Mycena vulgaris]|nr:hypothetical protein DFH09DRAFT_1077663 [Mycena vulgaris]